MYSSFRKEGIKNGKKQVPLLVIRMSLINLTIETEMKIIRHAESGSSTVSIRCSLDLISWSTTRKSKIKKKNITWHSEKYNIKDVSKMQGIISDFIF